MHQRLFSHFCDRRHIRPRVEHLEPCQVNGTGNTAMKADQVGALCIRRQDNGACQVLLITSRDTGRWIIPKGWRAKHLKDHEAAAREAEEEAGVSGKMMSRSIGNYVYRKVDGSGGRSLRVAVFLLRVRRERNRWRERDQRRRAWLTSARPLNRCGSPSCEP